MPEHPAAISLDGWSELTPDYSELARFWISPDRAFTLVAPDVAPPRLLGSLLVECVYTAADGYASQGTISQAQAMAEIWAGFDEERVRLAQQTEEEN